MFKHGRRKTAKSKKTTTVEKHSHEKIDKYFSSVGETEKLVFLESSLPSPDAAALPCATNSCKRIPQNEQQSVETKGSSSHDILALETNDDDLKDMITKAISNDVLKKKKKTQMRASQLTAIFPIEKQENIKDAVLCVNEDCFEIKEFPDKGHDIVITKQLCKRQKSIENTPVADSDISPPKYELQCIKTESRTNENLKVESNNKDLKDKKTKTTSSDVSKKKKQTQLRNSQVTDFFPVRKSNRKTLNSVMKEKHKNIEDAILCAKEDGFEIREFPEKGRGVVTTKPLKRGDFVLEYHGELIDSAEAAERERLYAMKENTGCYMYYFKFKNKRYCIDATKESGRLGRLVNHSKKGNLKTQPIFLQDSPHLALFAGRDIEAGEELTYDYGDRSKKALEFHPWLAL